MQESEIIRRLPEILKIEDDDRFLNTLEIFDEEVPDYFWEIPASTSSKYHPVDETNENGLWLHTKRVFTIYNRLSETLLEQHRLDREQVDKGRVAVLLHDSFRLGEEKDDNEHSVSDHGLIAAEKALNAGFSEEVSESIKAHDGAWGEGKAPETELEDLVHYADMVASERGIKTGVLNPHETLYSKPSVDVKEYIGVPRYKEATDKKDKPNLVYGFGCLKTRDGWRLLLKSPYEAKDDIKELDNRTWNRNLEMWEIEPDNMYNAFEELDNKGWDTDYSDRVAEFIDTFK